MTYAEKLKDPRWQKKRLEILERDDFTCQLCGNRERELHVHHHYYPPRTAPWDVNASFLGTLCKECHESAQGEQDELRRSLGLATKSLSVMEMQRFRDRLEQWSEERPLEAPHLLSADVLRELLDCHALLDILGISHQKRNYALKALRAQYEADLESDAVQKDAQTA